MIKKTVVAALLTATFASNLAYAETYQMKVYSLGLRAPISISLSTSAIDFGSVGNGGTQVAPLTVTNTGMSAADLALGASSGPYSLGRGACATSLAPGQQCNLTVTFSPTSPGQTTGSLSVSAVGAVSPIAVAVTGNSYAQGHTVNLYNGQGFNLPAGATQAWMTFNAGGTGTARWYLYRNGAVVFQNSFASSNPNTQNSLTGNFSPADLIPGNSYSFRMDGYTFNSAVLTYTY